MFFWFKRSKLVVDAFTCQGRTHELYPIAPANQHIPQWWKNTPKSFKVAAKHEWVDLPGNTIRRCAGVIDYFNKDNLIIPLWSDLAMDHGPEGCNYRFADSVSDLRAFEQETRGLGFLNGYLHLQLRSPWKVVEKTGIKFHFSQAFYNFTDISDAIFPPAIVNYKYQHSTEVNFFLKTLPTVQRIMLDAGQPLIMLTPLTEKEVVVKTHLIGYEEYHTRFEGITAFHNRYIKEKRIRQSKEKKCPFNFG